MSGHVVAAADLLSKIRELRIVAPIVRASHERWDGDGYPDGARGERIPLPSRIVAACDAYVAMTSDRAFRKALDEATAIQHVMEGAGTQLDPAVARALVDQLSGRESASSRSARQPRAPRQDRGDGRHLLARLDGVEPAHALQVARERVLKALAERHPNPDHVVPQLETDPGLALFALRAANRVAAQPVASIPEAMSVLGWAELERVVGDTPALDFLWPQDEWEAALEAFRLHAVAVQRAALRLADACGYEEVEQLAVSALLHDIGRLALSQLRRDYTARVRPIRSAEERLQFERREFGVDHATVGGILARRYGLPQVLAKVISEHHNDEAELQAQLLRLADALAHHSQGKAALQPSMIDLGRSLGVTPDELRAITFELPHSGGSRRVRAEPSPLSGRELDALRGLAEGKVYGEIAHALGVSTSTVRTHLHSVYRKLGVGDRAQAVLMATERGWL